MDMGVDPVHPGERIRESGEAVRGFARGVHSRPERPGGGVGRDGARA